MRLLDTTTLGFESFADSERPPFAILSHRWGKGEVSFHDMNQYRLPDAQVPEAKQAGYAKVTEFCALAQILEYDYAWMDTCCIDKSDNTELGEAINSMFRWYTEASMCIAYLWDVRSTEQNSALQASEWFDRGWTLQELIAPRKLSFYSREWSLIDSKENLTELLSSITGIPRAILSGASKVSACSIAQRLSWAARRRTERVEDRAYSLMGLFDVSLPMVYGEREKSFIKLQEAIIQKSDDGSIFAWSLDDQNHPHGYSGLLAPSPTSFRECGNIIRSPGSQRFEMTNIGLSLSLNLMPYDKDTYCASLRCTMNIVRQAGQVIVIFIAKLGTEGQYARVTNCQDQSTVLLDGWNTGEAKNIYIRQPPDQAPTSEAYGFWLRTLQPPGVEKCKISVRSGLRYSDFNHDRIAIAPGLRYSHVAGVVSLVPLCEDSVPRSQIRWLTFGCTPDHRPICIIATASAFEENGLLRHCGNRIRDERIHGLQLRIGRNSKPGSGAWHASLKDEWMQLIPDPQPSFDGSPRQYRLSKASPPILPMVWAVDITTIDDPNPPKKPQPRSNGVRNAISRIFGK